VNDPPAVEIHGLVKRYGSRTAVDDLSLRAESGQVTALLGPNGAGKTTTVEICEGYRRADAGAVRVLGLDPVTSGRALRSRVGVMLQSGGMPPAARAAEYLTVVSRFYRHPIPPQQLLDQLGLAASARTPVRRLSGGQQQRLSLAAAIVGRPDLVFLDEPTAGLDPQARHVTWDLLRGLRAAGATVILTTHYLDEAERLADYVVIVDDGRLVAEGSPDELTAGQGQVRFRAEPGLDASGLLAALPPGSVVKESPTGQYLIDLSAGVDAQVVATVTAWCAEQGVLARSLRIESRTLEDVFLELTGRELRS
jgi:ABC-2 type transport system ATP-binding protein